MKRERDEKTQWKLKDLVHASKMEFLRDEEKALKGKLSAADSSLKAAQEAAEQAKTYEEKYEAKAAAEEACLPACPRYNSNCKSRDESSRVE